MRNLIRNLDECYTFGNFARKNKLEAIRKSRPHQVYFVGDIRLASSECRSMKARKKCYIEEAKTEVEKKKTELKSKLEVDAEKKKAEEELKKIEE